MQGGLGASRTGATAHGSIGLIAHFGQAGSVRAGAGGGIGPFRPATGDTGALTVQPVSFGADVRVLGNQRDSLVAAVDAEIPAFGHLHVPDFDSSEPATTFRGFVGPGYHHDWWQMPKLGAERAERIAAGVTTSLGAELWYGDSKSAQRDSSLTAAIAFSVMFEFRAWLIGELFECLSAKNGCDAGN